MRLRGSQRAALDHVEAIARQAEARAQARIIALLAQSGCDRDDYREASECVREHARIVLHFHPDLFGTRGMTVAEALLEEGAYRNQFETGLSTGSLSAYPDGARDA
jgi:hypothetical protein